MFSSLFSGFFSFFSFLPDLHKLILQKLKEGFFSGRKRSDADISVDEGSSGSSVIYSLMTAEKTQDPHYDKHKQAPCVSFKGSIPSRRVGDSVKPLQRWTVKQMKEL